RLARPKTTTRLLRLLNADLEQFRRILARLGLAESLINNRNAIAFLGRVEQVAQHRAFPDGDEALVVREHRREPLFLHLAPALDLDRANAFPLANELGHGVHIPRHAARLQRLESGWKSACSVALHGSLRRGLLFVGLLSVGLSIIIVRGHRIISSGLQNGPTSARL